MTYNDSYIELKTTVALTNIIVQSIRFEYINISSTNSSQILRRVLQTKNTTNNNTLSNVNKDIYITF